MKKALLFLILNSVIIINGNAQNEKLIVEEFITAYNNKDSLKAFNYLHTDFMEYFEDFAAIPSKAAYSNNYAWGKVMNDRMEFQIIKISNQKIETMSTYYSDRDSLLNIRPFKSIRTYFIQNNQIIKIIESKFPEYEKYDGPRRKKYETFFDWVSSEYSLSRNYFTFDKKGAESLKNVISIYSTKK